MALFWAFPRAFVKGNRNETELQSDVGFAFVRNCVRDAVGDSGGNSVASPVGRADEDGKGELFPVPGHGTDESDL